MVLRQSPNVFVNTLTSPVYIYIYTGEVRVHMKMSFPLLKMLMCAVNNSYNNRREIIGRLSLNVYIIIIIVSILVRLPENMLFPAVLHCVMKNLMDSRGATRRVLDSI